MKPKAIDWIDKVSLLFFPPLNDHGSLEHKRDSPQKPAKGDFTLRSHPDTLKRRDETYGDAKLEHHVRDCWRLKLPPQQTCRDADHEDDTVVHSNYFELPLEESEHKGENALDTTNGRKKTFPAILCHCFIGSEVEERHKAPHCPRSDVRADLSLESLPIIDAEGEDTEKSCQNTAENIRFQKNLLCSG